MKNSSILLELQGVSKSYGTVKVLEAVDLAVRDGEFITILGPSGSGKTTILRMIGGFTPLSSGHILLDGKDIVALPINRRPFNTVFQDYALFPHMTVAANVGYGLRVRGEARAEIGRRVKEALALVQLGELADRYPSQLSGGQRQRVALARAIICQPRLILLDEPLAALDVALRRQMQEFLKEIQRQIRTTFLFVTHDQEEAIAMADRICVMNEGQILQLGTAHDVYYRPASEFVARFFGENNLIEGRLEESQGEWRWIATPIGRLRCAVDGQVELATAPLGRRAFAAFRPECVAAGPPPPDSNHVEGAVTHISFGGASTSISLSVGEGGRAHLRLRWPSRAEGVSIAPGQRLEAHWRPADCRLVLA